MLVGGDMGEQSCVCGVDGLSTSAKQLGSRDGHVQLPRAAAAWKGAALDCAELLQLSERGLHALRRDAGAAGELAVGERGSRERCPARKGDRGMTRARSPDSTADDPAQAHQQKGGADRLSGSPAAG